MEFPDEARCAAFPYARWPDGSLTAATAMQQSKLPLTTWFRAAHVMATRSNCMSARQLEDQLGVAYKTAWVSIPRQSRGL